VKKTEKGSCSKVKVKAIKYVSPIGSAFTSYLLQQPTAATSNQFTNWHGSLLPLGIGVSETTDGLQVRLVDCCSVYFGVLFIGIFVSCDLFQVVNVIQGSPASQLMGTGESGQPAPLIESGDVIVKVSDVPICE
jgi:hypothetical protein